ncbi:MAG TPA: hypothetical protein VND24_06170 [Steroidobacteraceae bacterium]|nr:hypothetical protein [Steroidobacteraceae bacterium]
MINAANLYVESEIRRLEQAHPSKPAFYREQWTRDHAAQASAERRALARWAGDRLIGAGERLRSWSTPQTLGNR